MTPRQLTLVLALAHVLMASSTRSVPANLRMSQLSNKAEAPQPVLPEKSVEKSVPAPVLEENVLEQREGGQVAGGQGWALRARTQVVTLLHAAQAKTLAVGKSVRLVEENGSLIMTLFETLMSVAIWCLVVIVIAYFYQQNKVLPEISSSSVESAKDFTAWRSGICQCFDNIEICLWSFCCPAIRWADTMSMVGFWGFWAGFSTFFGLTVLNSVTSGILVWAILAAFAAWHRQRLREKFDMEHGDCSTYTQDCLLYCCCWGCVISQEARHVTDAYVAGVGDVAKKE